MLVTKSCPALCNPINCSMVGFLILYYILEFAQIHVHWVGDAIQPSHPLLPSSPLALNLSQHQDLFQWVSSSHQVTKILEFQLPNKMYASFNMYDLNFPKSNWNMGLPQRLSGKESACNSGNVGPIHGLGRSPGEGNGNLLQYSCLGNCMERGVRWATVHGVTKESDMTEWLKNNKSEHRTDWNTVKVITRVTKLPPGMKGFPRTWDSQCWNQEILK